MNVIDNISKYEYATIDIETTGLNRFIDSITWIGVGLSETIEDDVEILTFNWRSKEDKKKFKALYRLMKLHRIKTVWQNGKFDTLFILWNEGIKLPIGEDVMLMGTAYDLADKHGLKYMANKYLGVEDWDIKNKDKLSGIKELVEPYLRLDIKHTWGLCKFFKLKMTPTQMRLYKKLLLPAYRAYRDIETKGVYMDMDEYQLMKDKYAKEEAKCLQKLKAKYDINWNSPQQKQKVLFTAEGENLLIIKTTPKGAPSADASVMKRLAAEGYKLPQDILKYSAANTLNKMFLNRWGVDASYDGRIHPSFKLTDVVSGRTSCTDPNLQQVPRTKDVRALFTAPKGRVFFEADYSQLELRIAAHYAKEPTMLKIYREHGDIHIETARVLTGGREPTKDERGKAKAVNFGFLYGMLAKKFVDYAYDSYGVTFTKAEAEAYRNAFFAKYSRLLPWHSEQAQICEAEGGVSTLFGRFRKLPKIYSQQRFERLEAMRRAINTPVQGTGSDILLSALIEVHRELSPEGLTVCGTIHDSIVGEFCAEDEKWIVPEIKKIMSHPKLLDVFGVELKVELEADVGVGPWGSK